MRFFPVGNVPELVAGGAFPVHDVPVTKAQSPTPSSRALLDTR